MCEYTFWFGTTDVNLTPHYTQSGADKSSTKFYRSTDNKRQKQRSDIQWDVDTDLFAVGYVIH